MIDVRQKALGHNFFKQFTAALQQTYWSVCFWEGVVSFVWFGDHNYLCILPWVMPQGERGIEKINKPVRAGFKGPFEELVCSVATARLIADPQAAVGRFSDSAGQ